MAMRYPKQVRQRWLRALALLLLFTPQYAGLSSDSCAVRPAFQHFVTREGSQLLEGANPYRFVSVNVPNLHRIEAGGNQDPVADRIILPIEVEIWDALCSVQQMGANATRIYVLSVGADPSLFHFSFDASPGRGLVLSSALFVTLDLVLQVANTVGVRVIIPFINTFHLDLWGSAHTLSAWAGVDVYDFFYADATKDLYKRMLHDVVYRYNSLTGVMYRDDPAILGWELGNELYDTELNRRIPEARITVERRRENPPPVEWSREMSDYLKSIDPNHLVIDGGYPNQGTVEGCASIDVVGATYYSEQPSSLRADVEMVAGRKAIIVKEFAIQTAFGSPDWVREMLEEVLFSPDVAGALYWSLRFHARTGGFYWHTESDFMMAMHWPGFVQGYGNYEQDVFKLLSKYNSAVNALPVNQTVPGVPTTPSLLHADGTEVSDLITHYWQQSDSDYFWDNFADTDDSFLEDFTEYEGTFPPCLRFAGAPGADSYELYITDRLMSREDILTAALTKALDEEKWHLLTVGVVDDGTEQSAWVSASEDILYAHMDEDGLYAFCVVACFNTASNSFKTCSDCSNPAIFAVNSSGAPSPACANATWADPPWYWDKLYAWEASTPVSFWAVLLPLLAVYVAVTAATCCMGGGPGHIAAALSALLHPGPGKVSIEVGARESEVTEASKATSANSVGSVREEDPTGRHIKEAPQEEQTPRVLLGVRSPGLDTLRLIGVLHLGLYRVQERYQPFAEFNPLGSRVSPGLRQAGEWGVVWYTLMFMTSGFLLTVRYLRTVVEERRAGVSPEMDNGVMSARAWRFLVRRFSTSYPLYLVALVGAAALRGDVTYGRSFWCFLGLSTWDDTLKEWSSRVSQMNEPGWVVGAFGLCFASFWAILPWLSRASPRLPRYFAAFWLTTIWQTQCTRQVKLLVFDNIVSFIPLYARLPEFLLGMTLGAMFCAQYKPRQASAGALALAPAPAPLLIWAMERCGASLALLTLVLLAALVDMNDLQDFFKTWVANGCLAPLFAAMIWAVASDRRADPLCMVLDTSAGAWLAQFAYPLYILQDLMWAVTVKWGDANVFVFLGMLVPAAAVLRYLVMRPARARLPPWCAAEGWTAARLFDAASLSAKLTRYEQLLLYYAAMAITFTFFIRSSVMDVWTWNWFRIINIEIDSDSDLYSEELGPGQESKTANAVMQGISWLLLIPMPALFQSLIGHVLFPPMVPIEVGTTRELVREQKQREPAYQIRLFFRCVTRGNNANLVARNVAETHRVLLASGLPREWWHIEVVTDTRMWADDHNVQMRELMGKGAMSQLVVPGEYRTGTGALFKARALQYAVETSAARRHDWIIHQDEESRVDEELVRHALAHCTEQARRVVEGLQQYGSIGQGVIKYNTTDIEHILTSLADSIRVADDYGKFAFQFRLFKQPLIGMHGSFVVCQNAVEMDITFDHGVRGSITEDTYFALLAAARGVQIEWMGGHMYEQSPFSVTDFCKQRCRWFSGLWLCVVAPELPLWRRVVLGVHVASWACCPAIVLLTFVNVITVYDRQDTFTFTVAMVYGIPMWSYVLGFVLNFRARQFREGCLEYAMMLVLLILLLPVFAVMEGYGVWLALVSRSPYKKFHVVQKELPFVTLVPNIPGGGRQGGGGRDGDTPAAADGDRTDLVPVPSGPGGASLDISMSAADWWRAQLSHRTYVVNLPLDRARTPVDASRPTAEVSCQLSTSETVRLLLLAEMCGVGTYEVLCTAVGMMCARYTASEEVILSGTCIGGSEAFPLPLDIPDGAVFGDVAKAVQTQRMLSRHFASPWREIMGQLEGWDESHADRCHPLAQVAVVETETGSPQANQALLPQAGSNLFDLAVILRLEGAQMEANPSPGDPDKRQENLCSALRVVYTPDLMDQATAALVLQRILLCVRNATASSACSEVVMMTPEEHRQVVQGFNMTAMPYADTSCIDELLVAQAAATPAAPALHLPDGTSLTYQQLCSKVKALAQQLQAAGVGASPKMLVGMVLSRSCELVVAVYAVLMCRAGYVPIVPEFPQSRVLEMLEDSQAPFCIVQARHKGAIPAEYAGRVLVVGEGGVLKGVPAARDTAAVVIPPPQPSDVVYVMYTSGTTGKPKGVVVEHGDLVKRTAWLQSVYTLQPGQDVVMMKTAFIFGVSEWELFWTLTNGASLMVAPAGAEKDAEYLIKAVTGRLQHAVSHMFVVPSMLKVVLSLCQSMNLTSPSKPCSLKHMICCGEAVYPDLCHSFYATFPASARLHNVYGPTEGSMTHWTCPAPPLTDGLQVLIGVPISNTQIYLLDGESRPVPIGFPGEIYFGGCLARGYLNRPELTQEKFVMNPFGPGRLYKSGDLGVWLTDGNLKFLGRADRQVKLRGYRIELQEVEAVIQQSGVSELAVVATKPTKAAEGQLIAYIPRDADAGLVKNHCVASLPAYMVPTMFIPLDEFPRLPTGKIDLPQLSRRKVEPPEDSTIQVDNDADVAAIMDDIVTEGAPASLAEFMASSNAAKLMQSGVDSIGIVRMYAEAVGSGVTTKEVALLDNMRAILMYGVIFDHFWACEDNFRCRRILDQIIWPQPEWMGHELGTIEILARSIGNYKTMGGFITMTAYAESGFKDSYNFHMQDVVVLTLYLQMLWIWDPVIFSVCQNTSDYCDDGNWYAGLHRWYLYQMLLNKVVLWVLCKLKIPPVVQTIGTFAVAFGSPEVSVCVSDHCSSGHTQPAIYKGVHWLARLFFLGAEVDPVMSLEYMFTRWYLFMVALHVFTYHHGRHVVRFFCRNVLENDLVGKVARVGPKHLHTAMLGIAFVSVCIWDAAFIGPHQYVWLAWGGYYYRLDNAVLALVAMVLEPCLLALVLRRVEWRLHFLGSTTLGTYIIHNYLTYFIAIGLIDSSALVNLQKDSQLGAVGGIIVQILIMLGLPLFVQCVIGPLFHYACLEQFKLPAYLSAVWSKQSTALHDTPKGEARAAEARGSKI